MSGTMTVGAGGGLEYCVSCTHPVSGSAKKGLQREPKGLNQISVEFDIINYV